MKSIFRKLLLNNRIRNYFCVIRTFYFCIIRNKMQNFQQVSNDTWKYTLDSNKRAVYDKDVNLPKHPNRKKILNIAISQGGSKLQLLLPPIFQNYSKEQFKKLKVLSIGPRSEGEIFNLFANGFELKNLVGVDLFSYSPLIKLGDMHNLDFNDEEFDIVLMGWCLAYSNNKKQALSEVNRVLKKKGLLVVGYTSINSSKEEIMQKRGYLVASPFSKINSIEDLNNLANSIGFKMYYSKKLDKKIYLWCT